MTAGRNAARRRGAEAALLLKVGAERPKRSYAIVTKIVLASFFAGVAVTLFAVWVVLP